MQPPRKLKMNTSKRKKLEQEFGNKRRNWSKIRVKERDRRKIERWGATKG